MAQWKNRSKQKKKGKDQLEDPSTDLVYSDGLRSPSIIFCKHCRDLASSDVSDDKQMRAKASVACGIGG